MTPKHYRNAILYAHSIPHEAEKDIAEFDLEIVRANDGFAIAKFANHIQAEMFDDTLPGVFVGFEIHGRMISIGRLH